MSFLKLSTHFANPKSANLKTLYLKWYDYPLIDKDVGWLQVAMDDAVLDKLDETVENIVQELQ
jgi:hypothetical protein